MYWFLEFVLYFILNKQCLCIEFKLQNLEYEKILACMFTDEDRIIISQRNYQKY